MERMRLLALSVIAFLTGGSHAWSLQTNLAEIVSGCTKNVQLTCIQDKALRESHMKLDRIRITKANAFCSNTKFAEVLVATNRTYQKDVDVRVTSNIAANQTAFLKITWPRATRETTGTYGCEIEGYTQAGNLLIVKVEPTWIREEVFTRNEVNKLISAATTDLEKKQRILELEIVDLKTLMNDSIESVKQQCRKDIQKSKAEMSDLIQRTESKFITKDDLAITALNVTSDELLELKLEKEKEHKHIYSLIQNSTSGLKSRCSISRLETNSNKSCQKLETSINDLESKFNQSLHEFHDKLIRLSNLFTSLDKKYENITTNLMRMVNSKNILCETATTSAVRPATQTLLPTNTSTRMTTASTIPSTATALTTTATPQPCNKRQWPNSFALVKPESGCPQTDKTLTKSKIISYTSFYSAPDDKKVNLSRLLDIKVHSGYSKRQLEFCSKRSTLPHTTRAAWPEGSYCILQQESCPEQFQTGHMYYFVHSKSKDVGFFSFPFCCRNDGPADSPIYLPCEQPFYLYRYAGVCQTVAGMTATIAYVTVDVKDDVQVSIYKFGQSPDVDSQKQTTLLCHYQE